MQQFAPDFGSVYDIFIDRERYYSFSAEHVDTNKFHLLVTSLWYGPACLVCACTYLHIEPTDNGWVATRAIGANVLVRSQAFRKIYGLTF